MSEASERFAHATTNTVKDSARELAKLFDGNAAIVAIRTKYGDTIVFDVVIDGDMPSFLHCLIDTLASLQSLQDKLVELADQTAGARRAR